MDRHQPHSRAAASKRPFLLLLSPDTLQLATAGDATDAAPPATVPGALLQAASLKPERSMRGPSIRPLALLHKLGGHGSSSAAPGDGDPSGRHATPEGAESRLLLEDGEPLEEGQLITFSIALSQVVGIEHDGCAIKARRRGGGAGRADRRMQPGGSMRLHVAAWACTRHGQPPPRPPCRCPARCCLGASGPTAAAARAATIGRLS